MESARGVAAARWQWVGICELAFLIRAGVRLSEAPGWRAPMFRVDGEYLLATHDAYAWVTGAELGGRPPGCQDGPCSGSVPARTAQ